VFDDPPPLVVVPEDHHVVPEVLQGRLDPLGPFVLRQAAVRGRQPLQVAVLEQAQVAV
jgi:hypothetical protein